MSMLSLSLDAVERGLIPDVITRAAIRRLCRRRLHDCDHGDAAANSQAFEQFLTSMRSGPIAPVPEKANEQHYELPPEFFAAALGPHRKYSSCYWPMPRSTLAEAEAAALEITCERADLRDGQDVLELGCGWGSLSLWMAEHFPNSRVTAVSNSVPQRLYIESIAAARGIANLRVITADMNKFTIESNGFDRVVSVEMFEHMRNFEQLLKRIASWLRPDGRLFVHHFCHRKFLYPFETSGDANWMGRYFFTGGIMPSENMLQQFNLHMTVTQQWRWDGTHYQRTSEAWLRHLDANAAEVMPILTAAYGTEEARRWFHRWRLFFLAVAELFGYAGGTEWFVAHTLLRPNAK